MLTCPACGRTGPGDRSENAFDYIDRDELLALRRCRRCGAVLLVRFTLFPTEAHAEVIPTHVWEAMQEARDGGVLYAHAARSPDRVSPITSRSP